MKFNATKKLIDNLQKLMVNSTGEIAKKSGISKRMIDYIMEGSRGASLNTLEKIADSHGLNAWHLLLDYLNLDAARSGDLDKLVTNFSKCDKTTQAYLLHVAEHGAVPAVKSAEQNESRKGPRM
ncbi:helix-turn-helix transcriptional regulator [Methylovorus menthalis]|uniref:helix-turn-helix domain-containing protein n=1 Tax=Methylovorus menthalis TaxID=1002227 RepID=UPI001E31500D|nr:helix-turn-helix transcriptional regulator [Methylovorus menthalis]MCB4811678.1 helix-turn-helix transcriptional regulator [Methylovorus menthalis]